VQSAEATQLDIFLSVMLQLPKEVCWQASQVADSELLSDGIAGLIDHWPVTNAVMSDKNEKILNALCECKTVSDSMLLK